MINDNYEIYKSRREPKVLTNLRRGDVPTYPPIRTMKDEKVIESLIKQLNSLGRNYVLMTWISPAFGRVVGYGVYSKYRAKNISERSKNEDWGFPMIGSKYNINDLERKLNRIKNETNLQI